jgi:6-pyruvoyltetrahydropterin/6-carboxytetrahydropterin synthase
MRISRTFSFSASHRLLYHEGKCHNIHGHGFLITVFISCNEKQRKKNKHGFVLDFSKFDKVIKEWIDKNIDHVMLIAQYDKELLEHMKALKTKYYILPDTSSEEMIIYFKKVFQKLLNVYNVKIDQIVLSESPKSNAYLI